MKLPVLNTPSKLVSERLDRQISDTYKTDLEKQAYRVVGSHSAVKVCHWTKSMIKNEGGCYKFTFYGIRSHQCLQMTTSMFCASRCTFCWRGAKAPVAKTWYGPVDDPEEIIDGALEAQRLLLTGFGGNDKTNPTFGKEKDYVRHAALSLTGEPITYPKINEILKAFHKREISTFLVTNAQYPDQLAKIDYCTQLYLSIDAPNRELLAKIDRPLFENHYERMLECLDILSTRPYRTCIRLTAIHDLNDEDMQGYGDLIARGNPDFIEVKGYMYVGHSQTNLGRGNMPDISQVEGFAEKLLPFIPGYEVIRSHIPSRGVLLMKKDLDKKCWIDFPRFFEMCEKEEEPVAAVYSAKRIQPNC